LGTILRSAEAFGATGALLGEGTVSQWNAKVVRAAAGSLFRLAVAKATFQSAMPLLKEREIKLVGTSSHKGMRIDEADLSGPIALLIGNEGAGIGRHIFAQIDELVAIPHSPKVESLNAAIAASVLLYEAARQRRMR
jgi:TrmH family RNA methyltransferase